MIAELIRERLSAYGPGNAVEQENMLTEMMHHFVLAALARNRFFYDAVFHGGTFLRIVHRLDRFSEDLDFVLKKPDRNFAWARYINRVIETLGEEGLRFEAVDKTDAASAVRKIILTTDAIGKLPALDLPYSRHPSKRIKIKLEIDTNPPRGGEFETHYLSFPVTVAVTTHTVASSFGSKSHALLCRHYTKGRDWYDFLWYVSRRARPDLNLLKNALNQQGPWAGKKPKVTPEWYLEQIGETIRQIDWKAAREDVRRFLGPQGRESLALWSTDFFLYHLEQLARTLESSSR